MEQAQRGVYFKTCVSRDVLASISDKWTGLIIGVLDEKPQRFSDLLSRIEGISQKMLTQNLRKLERDGLVTRTVDTSKIPISVTYSLTELGETIIEPYEAIRNWAEENAKAVTLAQQRFDAQARRQQ